MDLHRWAIISLIISALILEGLDIQIVAFAAPAIARDWGLGAAELGPAIGAALIGMMLGGAAGGYLGDRVGRRPALIGAIVFFALFTIAAAFAPNIIALVVLRLIAGLGFGAALPNATALAAEWSPPHLRSRIVSMLILGMPIGGIIGATLASWVVPAFGWRAAFAGAGILPLAVTVAMYFWLPESPEFRSTRRPQRDDAATPRARAGAAVLLSASNWRVTVGLTVAFFCDLLVSYLFLNYLPILLATFGESDAFAIRSSIYLNLLGMGAMLLIGWLIYRVGSRLGLLALLAPALVVVAIAAYLAHSSVGAGDSPSTYLLLAGLIGGAATFGAQAGLAGLAAHAYPVAIRASGIGWTTSIGRIGSVVSAVGGGVLVSLQPKPLAFLMVIAGLLVLEILAVLLINRHVASIASESGTASQTPETAAIVP